MVAPRSPDQDPSAEDDTAAPTGAPSHPLPAGMRDLLPEQAMRRRDLGARVLSHFSMHGFQLVMPPAFEFADILERGLGTLSANDMLRFVEPESGEVAALRPDMTPQIARMVATRLALRPPPIRLCYEGTIVRRRPGRARRHRQIPQAGAELYGVASVAGDLDMLRLAASTARAVGLERFVVDVGHAAIGKSLLSTVPVELRVALTEALAAKDSARARELLGERAAAGVPARIADALVALPELAGGGVDDPEAARLLAHAGALFAGTPAETPLSELSVLWRAAHEPVAEAGDDLGSVVRLDLGELRGFDYYTGAIFHVLASGPGEPIAAGGRYDELLGRFGVPMPAVGFALHLDAVAWAMRDAGAAAPRHRRILCATGAGDAALVAGLRRVGIAAVAHAPAADPAGHAAAWGFTHLVTSDGATITVSLVPPSRGAPTRLQPEEAGLLARRVALVTSTDIPSSAP